MKTKSNDGECAPSKVSQQTANERKRLAASVFQAESDEGKEDPECSEVLRKLDQACQRLFRDYRVPSYYSPEDLASDVKVNFLEFLPRYRGEVELGKFLYRIARNQLISVCRRKECDRFVDLNRYEYDDEAFDEGDFSARTKRGHRELSDESERQYEAILVGELLGDRPDAERILCERLVDDETATETAQEFGVSRQAVSKRRDRILNRMKTILEERALQGAIARECPALESQEPTNRALTQTRATA
jgi:RNA polymerase sigma factor (sigma-70 family)